MITARDISAYLNVIERRDERRWSWSYAETAGYWHVKCTGILPVCEIHLTLDGPSLCLQTDVGDFRARSECRPALWRFLLRLNDELPVVKFGLTENGKITLMAEAVAGQISLATVEELLELVIAVFLRYRREIELLAAEGELAELLESLGEPEKRTVSVTVLKREPEQG